MTKLTGLDIYKDVGEKLGDVGLAFLRIAFGKTYYVARLGRGYLPFVEKETALILKVMAMGAMILFLPICILSSLIGYSGLVFSKTHAHMCDQYLSFLSWRPKALEEID